MVENETQNKVNQLIKSLKLANQYEQDGYDNWALAVRLSVDDEVRSLSASDKEQFLRKVEAG